MGNRTRQRPPCARVNSPNHPPGTWGPDSRGGGRGGPGPDGSPRTVLSLRFKPRPVGDLHVPLPSIIGAQTGRVKVPSVCSHRLPAPPFRTPLDHTQLSPPKTAALQFNRLWMWVEAGGGFEGVEAKTTHYIMYLLIRGCERVTWRVELGVKGEGFRSK